MLFTASAFASLGSMIQPAQWMRFYAARSNGVLKRSALIFALVLTLCFFFGVMLVGLGGQVLYPLVDVNGLYHMNDAGKLIPNPAVGLTPSSFDQILVVVLKNHLPELLGSLGAVLAALILVAIMAAAMSTADSNLHALSALRRVNAGRRPAWQNRSMCRQRMSIPISSSPTIAWRAARSILSARR